FVIYARYDRIVALPSEVDLRGWWLLGTGLLLRLVGAAVTVDSLSAASLTLSLCGAVWLALGNARLRVLLPVVLLLVFCTPPPLDFTNHIAVELKEFAIEAALSVGNALGLGAVRDGASLFVPGQPDALRVADACGGLRSLVALTTLGYALAFFFGSDSIKRRVVLLVVAMPLALLMNVLRIVGLCFTAKWFGVEYAGEGGLFGGHTIMNAAEWTLDLAVLLAIDFAIDRRRRQEAG
ncbi:MAG: exosortase/archaeosortase family protein, partial [Planctomycetota bacterium]